MRNAATHDFQDTSYAGCDSVDKNWLERDSLHDGDKGVWMVKLRNVPCVIVMIKSYIGHDTGNEGEEGVTVQIKCAECDCKDKKYPERKSGHQRDDSSD